jgi:hypothetical protein
MEVTPRKESMQSSQSSLSSLSSSLSVPRENGIGKERPSLKKKRSKRSLVAAGMGMGTGEGTAMTPSPTSRRKPVSGAF